MANIKNMIKEITSKNMETGSSIPIWILNDKLNINQINHQLDKMAEQGIKKIVIRADKGIIPTYFSADFMQYLHHILLNAKNRNIKVLFSDDLQYANPGVHATLTTKNQHNRMKYLSLADVLKAKGPKKFVQELSFSDIQYVFAIKMKDKNLDYSSVKNLMPYIKGRLLQWNMPSGDWRIFIFRVTYNKKPVGGYVFNCLDSNAVHSYIESTFGNLRKSLPKESCSALTGFVVELPNIAPDTSIRGIPWSMEILKNLKKDCSVDPVTTVLSLFLDNYSKKTGLVRRGYYKVLLKLLSNNFLKPLYNYKKSNKLEIHTFLNAGDQFSGETLLRFNYSSIIQKYEIDGLSSSSSLTVDNPSVLHLFSDQKYYFNREKGSVILGRNKNAIGRSFKELKFEADENTQIGLTTKFIDGLYYSMKFDCGQRTPPNIFTQSSFFRDYRNFMQYNERKAIALKNSFRLAKVGVIFPSESFYASYNPSNLTAYRTKCQQFDSVLKQLTTDDISFYLMDEETCSHLTHGVKGEACLQSAGKGKFIFKTLIIPETCIIGKKFISFLETFQKNGGRIALYGITPYETIEGRYDPNMLKSLETQQQQLSGNFLKLTKPEELDALRNFCLNPDKTLEIFTEGITEKRISAGTFIESKNRHFFLFNKSKTENVRTEIKVNAKGFLYYTDLNNGALNNLPCNDSSGQIKPFIYNFSPGEACLLSLSDVKVQAPINPCLPLDDPNRLYRIILKDQWEFDVLDDNALPITGWTMKINSNRDVNAGYNLAYESYINVEQVPQKSVIFLNNIINQHINGQDSGYYPVEISFNGVTLKSMQFFGRGEKVFHENELLKKAQYAGIMGYSSDVTTHVRKGINRITIKTYGSSFDPLLIHYPVLFLGNFEVRRGNKGWMIVPKAEAINYGSWTNQGYPFFNGRIVYRQIFEKPETHKQVLLRFKNFDSHALVRVNGNPIDVLSWQPSCVDISKFIQSEKNKIEIEITNLQNNLIKMNEMPAGLTAEAYLDVYR